MSGYYFVSKDDDESTTPLRKHEAMEVVHDMGFDWIIVHRIFVSFEPGQEYWLEDDGERGFDLYIYSIEAE